MAVIRLKLDNLRQINNTLGHQTSERMLVEIGERLCRYVRAPNFGSSHRQEGVRSCSTERRSRGRAAVRTS